MCRLVKPHWWRSGAGQGCVAWCLATVLVLQTHISCDILLKIFAGLYCQRLSPVQLRRLPCVAQASCCIVSRTSNAHFDAYVLSESSLFVYPDRLVLKTCGTTKLLAAVPKVLALATTLGMDARRCKYSRASFLFPEHQVRASIRGVWFVCEVDVVSMRAGAASCLVISFTLFLVPEQ